MADLRMYPEGKGSNVVRYVKDVEVAFGVAKTFRQRVPVASLTTAGVAFSACPALAGVRWRVLDAFLIAIGGAVATSTSINIQATLSAATRELLVVAVAALTQSALVRMGAANAVILADGVSFTQNDANAQLTLHSAGGTPTGATNVDFVIDYVADPA